MKVAYIFSTSGHTADYKLGQMILPQLEANNHGAELRMFFFDDNNYALREGDPTGAAIKDCSRKGNFVDDVRPLCLITRTGKGEPGNCTYSTVSGVQIGCFLIYTLL